MITFNLNSPQLGCSFRIEVAFPPGFRNLKPPFPALVLNDSQNQWTNRGAYGGWHTDSIAADLFRKGRNPGTLRILFTPPWAFFKAYFLRGYIAYGVDGVIRSYIYAFSRLIRVAKAREKFQEEAYNKRIAAREKRARLR